MWNPNLKTKGCLTGAIGWYYNVITAQLILNYGFAAKTFIPGSFWLKLFILGRFNNFSSPHSQVSRLLRVETVSLFTLFGNKFSVCFVMTFFKVWFKELFTTSVVTIKKQTERSKANYYIESNGLSGTL